MLATINPESIKQQQQSLESIKNNLGSWVSKYNKYKIFEAMGVR